MVQGRKNDSEKNGSGKKKYGSGKKKCTEIL